MRIIIETDGTAAPTGTQSFVAAPATSDPQDAGAGPTMGAEADDSGGFENVGGPPKALVDELARLRQAGNDPGGPVIEDAGAGPQA